MRNLLTLSDDELVRAIDAREKRAREDDMPLARFQRVRTDLSRMAWNSFAEALGCDNGPIARAGVAVFPLDAALADRLLAAMLESPRTFMRPDDFALGYMQTKPQVCDYLNVCNEYRALGPNSLAALREFAAAAGPTIEKHIGHPFRIISARQFQLVPRDIAADEHVDGWPPSIRKLFVLPRGASAHSGTTRFRQRDGQVFTPQTDKPIWLIFENSVVRHAPVTGVALRPTLELDIAPAATTSLEPIDAGLAGWYPWFPTRGGLHEGTRLALSQCYADDPSGGWKGRLNRLLGR